MELLSPSHYCDETIVGIDVSRALSPSGQITSKKSVATRMSRQAEKPVKNTHRRHQYHSCFISRHVLNTPFPTNLLNTAHKKAQLPIDGGETSLVACKPKGRNVRASQIRIRVPPYIHTRLRALYVPLLIVMPT